MSQFTITRLQFLSDLQNSKTHEDAIAKIGIEKESTKKVFNQGQHISTAQIHTRILVYFEYYFKHKPFKSKDDLNVVISKEDGNIINLEKMFSN